MIVAHVIVAAVLGAFWRRWFGGWPSVPAMRLPKLVAGLALGLCATAPLPWQFGMPLAALMTAYWIPGHMLQEWSLSQWLMRYPPVGVFWWAANRFTLPEWAYRGAALDGGNAYAEFAAGAVMYGLLAAASHLALPFASNLLNMSS